MATATGYLFVAPFSLGGTGALVILDSNGAPVWFKPLQNAIATDLRVQRFRGTDVLTWWEGGISATGIGMGDYVVADTSYTELQRVRAGNGLLGDLHEFQLTERGTALVTAYERVGGLLDSVVQEIDFARGRIVFEWHSLAHVGPDESYLTPPASASTPYDYFHVNSVDVDHDGHLLVSARNTWTVYKIDRSTGAILWRLGGRRSDFSFPPPAAFAWQHDARRQSDGTLTLFDNSDVPTNGRPSRGLRLGLDDAARSAVLVASYVRPEPLVASAMGSVQALPNGNTLVGWGIQPYVTELHEDGSVALDVRLPESTVSYRAYRFPWRGRPAAPPALALESTGRNLRVRASWNGSTETAQWRVLGGDRRSSLRSLRTAQRRGFETPIGLGRPPAYLQLLALDKQGRVLGRSHVAATSR